MGTRQRSPVLRVIRKIAGNYRDQQVSDRDLLIRFVQTRDQDAFSALVRRHASMVMGVGLRVLRHYQDAEDVCQATFLLLAKKANTTAWRDSVANWLYQIAYQLSLKARRAANRRNAQEGKVPAKAPPDVLADISVRDLQSVLDEELSRLATKYRVPLLLCCLEGKTRDEAARFLGVSLSTLVSRLEKGREVLRRRLAGRDVPLSLALAAGTLFAETVRGAVPATLAQAVSQAALQAAAGKVITPAVSENVLALVKGGMHTMFLTKLKTATAALLVAGFLVGGLLIAGLGAMPDSSHAQQTAGQNKDKAPPPTPARKAAGRVKLRSTLKGHSGNVHCVTFSPDGKLLASGSEDSTIKIWDTTTGKEVKTLAGHEDIVWSLAFSPDGKSLASTSFNYKDPGKTPDSVKIWNVATWEEKVQLKDNKGGFKFCTFSPDGKVLAAASAFQNLAKLWDTRTGNRVGAILEDRRFGISSLLFSPDGKTLILGAGVPAGEDALRLWNWAEQKPAGTFKTEGRGCDVIRFTRDDKTLVTCNELGDITFWDFDNARARRTVRIPVLLNLDYSLVLSPGGKMVAERDAWADTKDGVAVQKGKILLRDIATGELFETIPVDGCQFTHRSMAFSAKGGMLAVGALENDGQAGIVRIWEVREAAIKPNK